MKSFGSVLAFTRERNAALLNAYRRHIRECSHINLARIGELVVNSPAPRFWASEERAASVVSAIMKGKPVLNSMRPSKREMFLEIYNRVLDLKKSRPNEPLCILVAEVVNSPAPKFYLEPSSALKYLFKIRNGWYDRHLK